MKTLEEFKLIKAFLIGQHIEPTIAMFEISNNAWIDLVIIARDWKKELDAEEAEEKAKLEAMTDEEREKAEIDKAEEAERDKQKILFHSSGHRPER